MRAAAITALLVLGAGGARAERLPLRAYGTAEGLPSTDVRRIRCDSRGLLWFATRDGLARFDGSRFVVYGTEQGLPVPTVNDAIEGRDAHWVATNGRGVCRLDPGAPFVADAGARPPLLQCLGVGSDALASHVNMVLEDRSGALWAASDGGLFRRRGDGPFQRVDLGLRPPLSAEVRAVVQDASGDVWAGTPNGLFRVAAGGAITRWPLPHRRQAVNDLMRDRSGNVWVGSEDGVVRVSAEKSGPALAEVNAGLPHRFTTRLLETRDGQIWAGTLGGLARLEGDRWIAYGRRNGLAHDTITALAEDGAGNLWIATYAAVMKLQRDGIIAYDESDGPGSDPVWSLYEGGGGEVYAVSGRWRISRFERGRFVSARVRPPAPLPDFAAQAAFRDREGGWWVLSPAGLGRFPPVTDIARLDGRAPPRSFGRRDGLPGDRIYRVFEDARGDVWIGGDQPPGTAGLARWDRATGRIESLPSVRAVPGDMPNAIAEDAAGALWVGFIRGGLGRLTGARFTLFTAAEGAPEGTVTAIHRDVRGRLWIGSNQDGLTRVDDPSAARPRFARYSSAQGLGSNNVRCIASDARGRIYAGTVRGVDSLDPATGAVRHYTTADGLPAAFVQTALRDSRGDVWFGTRSGLARLSPRAFRPKPAPPPVWIGGVRVGGVSQPVSHLGARTVRELRVEPDHNQVQVEFFAVGAAEGEPERYQHRLDSVGDWSLPSTERAVQLFGLGPGRHRLLVRSVAADGAPGGEPASVDLVVLPTLWQRGSVRGLLAAALALLLYGGHRARIAHALALERVRTRIASDLHDDIGANLSQIAILSEVARRQPGAADSAVAGSLEQIASLSRESVDSMGDIVWATNPGRDSLHDLSQRMRQHATELLGAHGIPFRFQGPAEDVDAHLDADVRRQVFLVFKEAVSNLARHSGCSSADIALAREDGALVLRVADDGRGLQERRDGDGHGLHSMAQRARELGGALSIGPNDGGGTVVRLRAPLKPLRRPAPYTNA